MCIPTRALAAAATVSLLVRQQSGYSEENGTFYDSTNSFSSYYPSKTYTSEITYYSEDYSTSYLPTATSTALSSAATSTVTQTFDQSTSSNESSITSSNSVDGPVYAVYQDEYGHTPTGLPDVPSIKG